MYPPSYPPPLRPIRAVAIFALAALAADSLVGIAVAVIDLQRATLIDRIPVDPTVTDAELGLSDTVYAASGIVQLATFLLAMVAFLVWLYKVRVNAEILAPAEQRYARPWVILGWIVPVVWFWYPKQVVDDVWTASHSRGSAPGPRSWLVTGWWAAWLIGNWVSNLAASQLYRAEELESMAAAARFEVVCIGVMLVAAGSAATVVYRISNAQEARRLEPVQQPGDGWGSGAVQQPGDGWGSGAVRQQPGDGWAPGAVQQRTGEGE